MLLGELITSRYVAESITMIAGRFGHDGLCQLHTKPLFITQHSHVISLVIYAPTLHHTTQSRNIIGHLRTHSSSHKTIGQWLLYNMSHTAVSSFVRSWQRPSRPKCPTIIAVDSATYLLVISLPDIDKVAMSLYDNIMLVARECYTYV